MHLGTGAIVFGPGIEYLGPMEGTYSSVFQTEIKAIGGCEPQ